jgi:hypothetical protein
MPKSTISKTAGFTQAVYDQIEQAADSGQFIGFQQSGCKGVNLAKPAITATGGALALKFAGATGPAAPFVAIGGALATLFGLVFGHHAAAVAQEQKVICAAVPSANDTLAAIYQAVGAGTLTPQQGQQALAGLLSDFTNTVHPILKMDSSHCNAACVWVKQLTAIVARQSSILQDQIDKAAAAAATTPSPGASSSIFSPASAGGGIPSWLLYAAGGVLLFKLL